MYSRKYFNLIKDVFENPNISDDIKIKEFTLAFDSISKFNFAAGRIGERLISSYLESGGINDFSYNSQIKILKMIPSAILGLPTDKIDRKLLGTALQSNLRIVGRLPKELLDNEALRFEFELLGVDLDEVREKTN